MSSDDGQAASDPAPEKTVSADEAGVTPGGAAGDGGRLTAGAKLGRYEIVEFIGGGGMGRVYRAQDTELEREVAIKVVQPTVAGPKGRDRLLAEARAMAKLRHRAVVSVFDVGEYAGGVYVAMALVEGGTLHDWMHAEARPWRQVVARFLEAGRGLVAAHAAGIVHRDFKPRNVLLGEGGEVLVADFGIASASVEVGEGDGTGAGAREATSIVGTPAYMAPEQAAGQAVDARADQYSFCVSLWEGLHGQRPQEAETRTQGALLAGATAALTSRRRAPRWLTDAIARGFATAPEQRWPSLAALLEQVERRSRRGWRLMAAGAGVAVAVGAAVTTSLVLAAPGAPRATCDVPDARIARVWDVERGRRLTTLLVAIDPQHGRDRAVRAVGAFDRAVDSWGKASVKACRETRIEGQQSEGMLAKRQDCLDRALAKIAASVTALEGAADAPTLDRRMRVLEDMPTLEACHDVAKLVEQPAPPSDPAKAQEYAALTDELAGIEIDRLIGNLVDHRARAAAAVPRARALGDPRLLARLLNQLASALHNDGDYEAEVRVRKEVIAAASDAHDDLTVADAWTSVVSTVAELLERTDEAEAMLLSAEAAVARAGNPARYRYDLLENKALIAQRRGDLPRALAAIDEGIAFVERHGGRDPGSDLANRMFVATGKRAAILRSLGKLRESIAAYQDTIALVTAKYGATHAFLTPYLGNAAQMHSTLGEHALAIEMMRRALAIAEQRFARSPRLAEMTWAFGQVLAAAGQFDEALPYLERALEMGRATLDATDPRLADFLSTHGLALLGVGRADAAIEQLSASVAIYEAKPATEDLGLTLKTFGDAQTAAGRWTAAIASYDAATATLAQTTGARSAKVAAAKLGPALLWTKRGQWKRALAVLDGLLADPYDDAAGVLLLARCWRAVATIELTRPPSPVLDDIRAMVAALHAEPSIGAIEIRAVDAWLAKRGVAANERSGATP